MTKLPLKIHAVAKLATVVLFIGLTFPDLFAKKNVSSQMTAPDFAYPQTVEKKATDALEAAVDRGDWPAAIEAAIQSVTAKNMVSHGNANIGIARLDSISAIAPAEWKPVFKIIEADIYTSLYNSMSWKADQRKLPLDSVPASPYDWSRDIFATKVLGLCKEILDNMPSSSLPLKDWNKFLKDTSDAYSFGMTADEFLYQKSFTLLGTFSDGTKDVIPFFSTKEEAVTPGQKCSALRDKAINLLIESTSSRRQDVLLAKAFVDKSLTLPYSLRQKHLMSALKELKDTEGEQLILSNLREYVAEYEMEEQASDLRISKAEYVGMLRRSIDKYPKGIYVNSLKNIVNDMTQPYAEIIYKNQYLTSSPINLDVKLSNCNESWILVYDYAPYANAERMPKTRDVAAKCRLVKKTKVSVQGNVPFSAEAKAEIGSLPAGQYMVIPSATPDSKGIYPTILNDTWHQPFFVSDISVMTLQGPDATTRVFVVDGENGRPIEGAQVKVYSRKNYTAAKQLLQTLTTDKDGSVTVTAERFDLEALYNGSRWSSDSWYHNSSFHPDTVSRNRIQILADRGLCHPGDSIRAVIVAYNSQGFDLRLNAGQSYEVSLRDANGNDVATSSVTTDSYGRATIEFAIPEQGLLGTWQITAYDNDKKWLGNTSIQVADYVAPTFFISSEHSDEDVTPGDVVRLKGQVLTYSGMPVSNATVRYSVSYNPPMRWFVSSVATYDSSVTADAEGKYEIELPTANLKGTQFERGIFSVMLSATSAAGETQNGPTERFAIGKEFNIVPNTDNILREISDSVADIIFNVRDIMGRNVRKELSYKLIDRQSEKIVAEGTFMSPILSLPGRDYPSAVYKLETSLTDDPSVKYDMQLTLWRKTDKEAPQGTTLWIPETKIVADKNAATVNVTIGSGIKDRWIPAVLSADGEIIKTQWLHVENDNISLPVNAPQGKQGYRLDLSYLSDLTPQSEYVSILPTSSEDYLRVTTESFRDKISAGDKEHWSFRFYRKSGNATNIPAMAVMTDAALNSIAPFKWNFYQEQQRHPSFYSMRENYNTTRHMHNSLKSINYLRYPRISYPDINDYGERWGLFSYYDSDGTLCIVGSIKNEMAVRGTSFSFKERKMAAAAPAPMANAMVTSDSADMMKEEAVETEEEVLMESPVEAGGNAGVPDHSENTELRETEFPVAFFMPYLVSDNDGIVEIDFTVPNFNTTWALQLVGYDSSLQTAKIALESVSSKPIMVSTHAPRFVRTGDVVELTATVFNNSENKCSAKCRFELVDVLTGKTIKIKEFNPESIEVAKSRILSMQWSVPSDVSGVAFRAYAEADSHSDGEQALVPVLPASSPVVESTPFWLAPGSTKLDVKLPKFKDSDQITLQYCDNPAWYCITALPDIVTPDSKSVTSKMRALYGNVIAYNLISSNSNLREGLGMLLSDRNSQFAALKSNLEKDASLKITQLNNTPWVNNAESETLRMSRLGSLLEDDDAQKTIGDILDDIRVLQDKNGGWSWCPQMEPSPYITRELLSNFAMIIRAGAQRYLKDADNMIKSGIRYVDSETVKDYRKYHKKGESSSYLLDWLYVRSSFPAAYISSGATGAEMSSIAAKARKDIAAEWKEMGIGSKAKAATVLWRAGDHKTVNEILESLRQFASESPEKGMWFDNLSSGWGGMSALRTTTLVLEAFAEIQPNNRIIDSLRQWLVLGRQYQDWGKSTYTVETVNAILTSGTDWTGSTASEIPEFFIKGKKLDIPETAKLTGAFTMTLSAGDASKKTLSVTRTGASPAWGGVIAQYEAPILDVVAADVPELSIRKSIVALEEGENGELTPKEGITLEKGMKVRVTLFITAGRDMDYVAVTDERSACLEPIEQLSGYTTSDRVGFYREVRNTGTNLFFGWLPKGQHVVTYDCRVSQDGDFSCGIATAQSQYSPLTVAHSAGTTLKVK